MNYYFCAIIISILSYFISIEIVKHYLIKGINFPFLYILLTLPLSTIVNIIIKQSIFFQLFRLPREISLWPIWFLPIALIIGALAEEGIKIIPLLCGKVLGILPNSRGLYIIGILAGLGFGVGEAWYLAYTLNEKTPEFASGFMNLLLLLLGFGGERFFAIVIHMALTGLVGYGLYIGKPLKYFLLASLLHSIINVPALLYKLHLISDWIAGILIAIAFCLLYFFISSKFL